MPDLCVERAIEPAQDEALSHLVGIGLGRAIAVIGDQLGTRLIAHSPSLRFVSLADGPDLGRDDEAPLRRAVRSDLHGSVVAHAVAWLPEATVSYYASRVGDHPSWNDATGTMQEIAALELGEIVLSSVLEGLRPILPDRGWFSHPALASEASHWWQGIGRSAVGGLLAELEIEDAQTSLEAEVCLLTGPRGLDLLLGAVEQLLVEAA